MNLPENIKTSVAKGAGGGSLMPVIALAATAPKMDQASFVTYYTNSFLPLVNHLSGVGVGNLQVAAGAQTIHKI